MRLRWSPRRSRWQPHRPTPRSQPAFARARDSVILPMWMGPGFNQALGLPFESLDAASGNPLPAERYRAMACARQLYVYAEASGADAAAHADRLFESLCAHFQDARGGWRYSVDAQARPLDETRISIPTPSSCSPAPRISGARATPRRASSCWARRKPSRLASRPDGLRRPSPRTEPRVARPGPESHDASDRSLPGRRAGGRTGAVRAALRAGAGHLPAFRACAHAVCPRRRRNPGQPA